MNIDILDLLWSIEFDLIIKELFFIESNIDFLTFYVYFMFLCLFHVDTLRIYKTSVYSHLYALCRKCQAISPIAFTTVTMVHY